MNFDIFKYLESSDPIYSDFDNLPEDVKKGYSQFVLNRMVGSMPFYLTDIEQITQYKLPDFVHYNYLYCILRKQHHYFNLKLYKSEKDEDLQYICKEFQIGLRDARYYKKRLNRDQMKFIINKWKQE